MKRQKDKADIAKVKGEEMIKLKELLKTVSRRKQGPIGRKGLGVKFGATGRK